MTYKNKYQVIWSDEDEEFVGLCAKFPSLSWVAPTKEEALQGIKSIVAEVIADLKPYTRDKYCYISKNFEEALSTDGEIWYCKKHGKRIRRWDAEILYDTVVESYETV